MAAATNPLSDRDRINGGLDTTSELAPPALSEAQPPLVPPSWLTSGAVRVALGIGDPAQEGDVLRAVPAFDDPHARTVFAVTRRCHTAGSLRACLAAGEADAAIISTELNGLEPGELQAVVGTRVPTVLLTTAWQDTALADDALPPHVRVLPANASTERIHLALLQVVQPEPTRVGGSGYRRTPGKNGTPDQPGNVAVLRAAGILPLQEPEECGAAGVCIAVLEASREADALLVSVNLTDALAQVTDEPVVLVDGDLDAPSVATALGLDPLRSVSGLAQEATSGGPDAWPRALSRHVQMLHETTQRAFVLAGVPRPGMRAALTPDGLAELLKHLGAHFGYVIAHVGASLDPDTSAGAAHRALVLGADQVLLVTTPDIVGLRRAKVALDTLAELGVRGVPADGRPDRVSLVLNRYPRGVTVPGRAEIADALTVQVAALIPQDDRAAQRALAAQRPLVAVGQGRPGRAATALMELATHLHAHQTGRKDSWLTRVRARVVTGARRLGRRQQQPKA